jgi:hypothetical protein
MRQTKFLIFRNDGLFYGENGTCNPFNSREDAEKALRAGGCHYNYAKLGGTGWRKEEYSYTIDTLQIYPADRI